MGMNLSLLFLTVIVLSSGNYELLQELLEPSSSNYQVAISENSGVLAIGSNDGELHIYFNNGRLFSNHQIYSFGEYSIKPIGMTPDGQWIAVAGYKRNPGFKTRILVFHY